MNHEAAICSDPDLQLRLQVDRLCRQFERNWRAHQTTIEQFLSSADQTFQELLLPELIAIEWELRLSRREVPQTSDYADRFPEQADLLRTLAAANSDLPSAAAELSGSRKVPEAGGEFCGYHILKTLGHGAMGTVFLAEAPVIAHQVALKILAPGAQSRSDGIARFEREARILARLDHPGIVPLYSYGESDGTRYLVMKVIRGESLASALSPAAAPPASPDVQRLLDRNRSDRYSVLLKTAIRLTDALHAVHDAGILHRDIKPSNILLSEAGEVFLTDFSLSRDELSSVDLTREDQFVGTLRYCAPESLDGIYSRQSDIYALGLVLTELCALRPSFDFGTRRDVLQAKLRSHVPELDSLISEFPPVISEVLRKMTATRAEDRYRDCTQVLQALRQAEQAIDSLPSRRSAGWPVRVSVAIAILGATLCLAWIGPGSRDRSPVTALDDSRLPASRSADSNALSAPVSSPGTSASSWLVAETEQGLPTAARRISISEDGSHTICIAGNAVFSASLPTGRLALCRDFGLTQITSMDQSCNGKYAVFATRDAHLKSRTRIEVFSSDTSEWHVERRVLSLNPGNEPEFTGHQIPGFPYMVLVPDEADPCLLDAHARGSRSLRKAHGRVTRINSYGNPHSIQAAALADGRIVFSGISLRNESVDQDWTVESGITDCDVMEFSPNGNLLAIVGNGVTQFISIPKRTVVASFTVMDQQQPEVRFSPDSQFIALTADNRVQVVRLPQGKWSDVCDFSADDQILLAVPLPAQNAVLVVDCSGHICLIPFYSRTPIHRTTVAPITAADFSPLASRLVIATSNAKVLSFRLP